VSRSRSLLLLGVVTVLLAALRAPAEAASTPPVTCFTRGVGVGIIDIPKGTKDPRAQNYIVDHVAPGARFSRRFQVCNGTDRPVTVKLYAGAAVIENGAFRIIEGRASNELSSWIAVTPGVVTVPAGRRVLATATVTVPDDVRSGERYAVLLAELPAQGSGVKVANRVGVRVYLDVGRGAVPASDFRVDSLQASRSSDGRPVVTARVRNTGGRALDISGDLNLRNGPGGLSGGPFPAQLGTTLAPGDTEPVTVLLSKAITGGPWLARLVLRSGLIERQAEATISFPDAAGTASPPVKAKNIPLAKDRRVLVPLAGGLIGIVLVLLFFLWLFAKLRNRRQKRPEDED
jgi:hypothetical protein